MKDQLIEFLSFKFTFGHRCVYGARILIVTPVPYGLSGGHSRNIIVWIQGCLYDFVLKYYTNFKNRKTVARRHIVSALHNYRT